MPDSAALILRDAASVQFGAQRIATVLNQWLGDDPCLHQRAYSDLTLGAMRYDGEYSPDWNEVLQNLSNEHRRDEADLDLYRFTLKGKRFLVRALSWKDGPTVCNFAATRLDVETAPLETFLSRPTKASAVSANPVVSRVLASLLGGDLPEDRTVECWRSVTWFTCLGISAEKLKNKRRAKKDPVGNRKVGHRWEYEVHSVIRSFPGDDAGKIRTQLSRESG